MGGLQALEVLTRHDATTAQVSEATRVLQRAPPEQAIETLCGMAFRPINSDAEESYAEAAFVLLRPRLVSWNGASGDPLRQAVEAHILAALAKAAAGPPRGDRRRLSAWRLATLVASLAALPAWPTVKETAHRICVQRQENSNVLFNMTLMQALADERAVDPAYYARFADTVTSIYHNALEAFDRAPASPLVSDTLARAVHVMIALLRSITELRQPACAQSAQRLILTILASITRANAAQLATGNFVGFSGDDCAKLASACDLHQACLFDAPEIVAAVHELLDQVDHIASRCVADDARPPVRGLYPIVAPGAPIEFDSMTQVVTSALQLCVLCILAQLNCGPNPRELAFANSEKMLQFAFRYLCYPVFCSEQSMKDWAYKQGDLELSEEQISETAVIAWEQWDRLLANIAAPATRRALVQAFVDKYLNRQAPLECQTGVLLLATALVDSTAEADPAEQEWLKQPLLAFERILLEKCQSDAPEPVIKGFQEARCRWAALSLITEVVVNAMESEQTESLGPLTETRCLKIIKLLFECLQVEYVPKLKVKFLSCLCQLCGFLKDKPESEEPFRALCWPALNNYLLSLVNQPMLAGCQEFGGAPCREHPVEIAMQEGLYLLIGRLLSQCNQDDVVACYDMLMQVCLTHLQQIRTNPMSAAIAEGILDLAGRLVEVQAQHYCSTFPADVNEPPIVQPSAEELATMVPAAVQDNALFLFNAVLELVKDFGAAKGVRPELRQLRTGLGSPTFFSTMMLLAMRSLNCVTLAASQHGMKALLQTLYRKMRDETPLYIQPNASQKDCRVVAQTNVQQTAVPVLQDEKNPDVSAVQIDGSLICVNRQVVEHYVDCLEYFEWSLYRYAVILTPTEMDELVAFITNLLMESPFPTIRRACVIILDKRMQVACGYLQRAVDELPANFLQPNSAVFGLEPAKRMLQTWHHIAHTLIQLYSKDAMKLAPDTSRLLYEFADCFRGLADMVNLSGGGLLPAQCIDAAVLDKLCETLQQVIVKRFECPPAANDEDDETVNSYVVVTDAVQQVLSPVFIACGPLLVEPFNKWLAKTFAAILTTPDMSLIARTAAVVMFGRLYGTGQYKANVQEFLALCLAVVKPKPLHPAVETALKSSDPGSWFDVRATEMDDVAVLGPALAAIKAHAVPPGLSSDAEVVEAFMSQSEGDNLMLHGTLFCLGILAGVPEAHVERRLREIDQTVDAILSNPLSKLSRWRIVLDTLCCTVFKVVNAFGQLQTREADGNGLKYLNPSGCRFLVESLFPLMDDEEDARAAYDILLEWTQTGKQTYLQATLQCPVEKMLELVLREIDEETYDGTFSYRARASGLLQRYRARLDAHCV